MRIFKLRTRKGITGHSDALSILNSTSPCVMNYQQRIAMTSSCKDTDYIPKITDAGSIRKYRGQKVQIMHNGLKVKSGGYFGDWMSEIILNLKGHHEPQEEKVFYEVLRRLDKPGAMIELGAFWAYYSLWYKLKFPNSLVISCEPDPLNIDIGKNNAELNDLDINFIQSAAGSADNKRVVFRPDSSDYNGDVDTIVRTVDGISKEYKIKELSLLHIDVQGSELDALNGAIDMIKSKSVRFLFVSTHHYSISGVPSIHLDCIDWIIKQDGYIITEHNVTESYSGDGLIVASFNEKDKDFKVNTSINSSNNSLFRSYERDLVSIIEAYNFSNRSR